MPESQVSVLQLHWKKRLEYRFAPINFTRYLRHLFYRAPPGDCIGSTDKYFTNKIVKNPLKNEKKEATGKKSNDRRGKKILKHYLPQVFIFFYFSKISLFLFSLLSMRHWKHLFLETIQFHWEFIYHRKLFLTFVNLTLISVNTRIFVKTNNKRKKSLKI